MALALSLTTPTFSFRVRNGLILAAAAIAFAATFAALKFEQARQAEERYVALDSQARFAAIAVDTKIAIELQQLRELAQSKEFALRNYAGFYEEARALAKQTGRQVTLFDLQRNAQIFNTLYPFNSNLQDGAKFLDKMELDEARTTAPFISNFFYAPLAARNLIAITFPLLEEDKVRYRLGVPMRAREISAALKDATITKGTFTSAVDRAGVIIGRSADSDSYVGRKAPANPTLRTEKSGRYSSRALDGSPINISYVLSDLSGWAFVSFERDREDHQWPLVAALLAALTIIVSGATYSAVANVRRRRMKDLNHQP